MLRDLVATAGNRLRHDHGSGEKFRMLVRCRTAELSFEPREAKRAQESMDALLWKFSLAGIHLERLWTFREEIGMQTVLDASLQHHRLDSAEELAAVVELEGFLYQTGAMLDAMRHHILAACKSGFQGKMSSGKFGKAIKNLDPATASKGQTATSFVDREVLAEGCWGHFLGSLRDRIAHQDRLRPGTESNENVHDKPLDWPTIGAATFHRRAQDFENGAWEMLTTVIPPLWDRQWISGPPRDGMWTKL